MFLELQFVPPSARAPRFGHGKRPHPELTDVIARHHATYRSQLETIARYRSALLAIPTSSPAGQGPAWINGSIPGMDAAAIYSFIRSRAPARYVEVGSGYSTLFADRARSDGRLATEIVSVDPDPPVDVDAVCDRTVRVPLEESDLRAVFDLEPGDVVFIDGSHQLLPGSDVAVFYLEVLPRLPDRVLVGVHDVELPDDYSPEFVRRHYSEQYLLAAYLLAGAPFVRPVLASMYAHGDPELSRILEPLWSDPHMRGVEPHGGCFWFETGSAS